jgi:hypothetical protein
VILWNRELVLGFLGDLDEVQTYNYKAERAAALIYAHFRKEFGLP